MNWRDPSEELRRKQRKLDQRNKEQAAKLTKTLESLARRPAMPPNSELEALRELGNHEQHYANTILLLGYGGFFALWASTAGHMSRLLFGLSGSLMSVSLLFFICFELAKTFAGSSGMKPGESVSAIINRIEYIKRWWKPVFAVSVLTGLLAGGIVLWSFAQNALDTEWQTPVTPNVSRPAPPASTPHADSGKKSS